MAATMAGGTFDSASWIRDDLRQMRTKVPGHVPPVLDQNGFELNVHTVVANRYVDRLYGVQLPDKWQQTPRFSTRSELRQSRAATMLPHVSFDVDGDGFVGQQDFKIGKKHDLGSEGQLTGGQRDSAIAEACYKMGTSLNDDEIGGNMRARRVLTSLRDEPELNDTKRREQRLRVGGMAVSTLKMKSSQQLKDCLKFPEAHVPTEGAPVYTRTMLLQQRRDEKMKAESDGHDRFIASIRPPEVYEH